MKYNVINTMCYYFMQFNLKIRQIKDTDKTLAKINIICHLLLTMPDSYDNLIVSIESMDKTYTRVHKRTFVR